MNLINNRNNYESIIIKKNHKLYYDEYIIDY